MSDVPIFLLWGPQVAVTELACYNPFRFPGWRRGDPGVRHARSPAYGSPGPAI